MLSPFLAIYNYYNNIFRGVSIVLLRIYEVKKTCPNMNESGSEHIYIGLEIYIYLQTHYNVVAVSRSINIYFREYILES